MAEIINLQDQAEAEQQYQALHDENAILMVVLGNSDAIAAGVQTADNLAPTSPGGFTRKVMWVQNHTMLKDKLEPFLHAADIIDNLRQLSAYFLLVRAGGTTVVG